MTRNPPSGQFPTGFVPTTASFCTGCDVTWNGSGLVNGTRTGAPFSGPAIPFPGISISGYGAGQYLAPMNGYPTGPLTGSWPSGVSIANVSVVYNSVRDGNCGSQTGAIVFSGTSGTGTIVYTNVTGCTGISGCFSPVTFYVQPDSMFLLGTGQMTIVMTDYCGGGIRALQFRFPFYDTNGNQIPANIPAGYEPYLGWPMRGYTTNQSCGQDCYYDLRAVWYPPANSLGGTVRSITGWKVGCSPCTGN